MDERDYPFIKFAPGAEPNLVSSTYRLEIKGDGLILVVWPGGRRRMYERRDDGNFWPFGEGGHRL